MTPAAIAHMLQERIADHMESVLGYSVRPVGNDETKTHH
jgi:hypothetical protein